MGGAGGGARELLPQPSLTASRPGNVSTYSLAFPVLGNWKEGISKNVDVTDTI